MAPQPYQDRAQAGRVLARALDDYRGEPGLLVLALPRGGLPVAAQIAQRLGGSLDVLLVRKLGAPGHEELAMGAIASGGIRVLNEQVVASLGITPQRIDQAAHQQKRELDRRAAAYRGDRAPFEVQGRTILVVDDGIATGSTVEAAVGALRRRSPRRIIVAVPVAPPQAVDRLRRAAGVQAVVCPRQPPEFRSVGQWYDDFEQVTEERVGEILRRAWEKATPNPRGDGP